MRLIFFWRIDSAHHLAINIFYRADLGPQVIERFVWDVAVGAFSADALGILEVNAALIFGQRLLHGMTGHTEGGVAGFVEYRGGTRQ
ncbi:hypothetical protein D3C80_1612800 [compost metagenome]